MIKSRFKWSNLYLWFVFLILYAPIFYLMFYSFNKGGNMHTFSGFTLKWYKQVFNDVRLLIIVLNTVSVALLSALFSTIIGIFGALAIYFAKTKRAKNALLSLNNVLIVSSDVIIGASFLILFTLVGIKLGFFSVLLSHIAFGVPIVVLMIYPRLQEMNKNMIDAASDLGANRWQVMSRVLLPAVGPGIYAGFFMAFTYSMDDFAVTFFVTGNGFTTLSVEIYSLARRGISMNINALSTILFLIILAMIFGFYAIDKRKRREDKL